jgi:transposase
LEILHSICCGLDVHAKTVVACLFVHATKTVRTFSTTTQGLLELADWLLEADCPVVAMESTGVYWKPVYAILEQVVDHVIVANARHVKQVPGRKTDVKDAEWLADLARHGLLKPSFVPPSPIRDLRELVRYRATLVRERATQANRIQKVAETGGVKLGQVLSDVLGVSGRRMLRALATGERDVARIAALGDRQLAATPDELRRALENRLTKAQRFVLAELLDGWEQTDRAIARVSERIREEVGSDEQDPFVGEAVRLLDEVTGIGEQTAQVIIAEIGVDMSRFGSAKRLASWAGVCPGNNESGGRRRSGRTTKGNVWLKTALTQAAWAAVRRKNSYLALTYQRLKARRGGKRALVAIAHKLVVIIYHMLDRREPFTEADVKALNQRTLAQQRAHLIRKLEQLGTKVTIDESCGIDEAA